MKREFLTKAAPSRTAWLGGVAVAALLLMPLSALAEEPDQHEGSICRMVTFEEAGTALMPDTPFPGAEPIGIRFNPDGQWYTLTNPPGNCDPDAVPSGETVAAYRWGNGRVFFDAPVCRVSVFFASKYEVTTDISYDYTGGQRAIHDLKTVTMTIDVPDHDPIANLRVRLNISHASPDDLVASLISPNGIELTVIGPITSGNEFYEVSYPGTFGPGDLQLDGTWTLEVTDEVKNRKRGTLIDWSLVVIPSPKSGAAAAEPSAAAADAAMAAWGELGSADDDDTDPITGSLAADLALLLVE